jgi:cyclopropane-fatty-acyl-phospholipid synthase
MLVRNRDLLDAMEKGWRGFGGMATARVVRIAAQTRAAAVRHNIARTYDLGNEFFRPVPRRQPDVFVGIYADASESLESASTRKLDRVCRKLELCAERSRRRDSERLGRFRASRGKAFRLPLSRPRRFRARNTNWRASASRTPGLERRVTVLLEDYRDLAGSYDKLVSIEMVEAIGHSTSIPTSRRSARCWPRTAWR